MTTAPTLLFDLDGTLTDNYAGIAASIGHALSRLGAPMPDAAVLRDGGARMFVCTAKPLPFARRIVGHFGLDPHFENVYGPGLDGSHDDKALLLAHLLAEERIAAGSAVMIGDRAGDVRAARANGVAAVGVLWGYGSRSELMAADGIVESPAELVAALERLAGAAAGGRVAGQSSA